MKPARNLHWHYSSNPALERAVSDILTRYPQNMRLGLDNIRIALAALGDPHLSLPPVFHAAGTNGKGSTLAFAEAILKTGGRVVHKFTSPHLVRFNERFVIANEELEDDVLMALIGEIEAAVKISGAAVSFFEFFTVLFFYAAARYPADAVLLETGLGGLLDSTNVIEHNACAIITRLSFDHTHILGTSLQDIAQQKAGIVKKDCPVVIAPQPCRDIFDVLPQAKTFSVDVAADNFRYKDEQYNFTLALPNLGGAHQAVNAGAAIAAIAQTNFRDLLTTENLSRAMQNVNWPGRWQHVTEGVLARILPKGWELWLDGAHNDSGAEVLAAELARRGGDKWHLLTAFKSRKDPAEFYAPLAPYMASVSVIDGEFLSDMPIPMLPATELRRYLETQGLSVHISPDLESALARLAVEFDKPQRILIAGSLYLVGHALKVNG